VFLVYACLLTYCHIDSSGVKVQKLDCFKVAVLDYNILIISPPVQSLDTKAIFHFKCYASIESIRLFTCSHG
jgi:hypothetical protein